jgi:hypothetical protein
LARLAAAQTLETRKRHLPQAGGDTGERHARSRGRDRAWLIDDSPGYPANLGVVKLEELDKLFKVRA